jgi:hypothetical protein
MIFKIQAKIVLCHVQPLADLYWYAGGGCCVIIRYVVVLFINTICSMLSAGY